MSAPQDDSNPNSRMLNGWKEIATYARKMSVRSAQRAESAEGLPVRRLRTPTGQIVYADPQEIDEWRKRREETSANPGPGGPPEPDTPDSRPTLRPRIVRAGLIAGVLTAALAAGIATGSLRPQDDEAVQFRLVGRALEGVNADGATVWRYMFDRDVSQVATPGHKLAIQEVDLDGDGEMELLVPTKSTVDGVRTTMSDALYCFSRAGALKWSVMPDENLTYGGRTFSAPWILRDLEVATAGPRRVWLAYAHHTWWATFILEVSAGGQARLQFAQEGRIHALSHRDLPDGPVLVAAGNSHRLGAATLAFLADADAPSSLPHEGDDAYSCDGCPTGQPRRVLQLPPTETARDGSPYSWISRLEEANSTLEATVRDFLDEWTLVLDPQLTPASLRLSPRRWEIHRELERLGRVDHTDASCPERTTPRLIREWTPAAGWRDLTLAPAATTGES